MKGLSRVVIVALTCGLVGLGRASEIHITLLRVPDGGLQPQIAVDPAGDVRLLYLKGDPGHGDLFYAKLDRDGQFSRALQVNTNPGSVLATGSVRGGQIAIGGGGHVHVAWHGSDQARPKTSDGATPVLYARMNDTGTGFEPERNIAQAGVGLDGATVAADPSGHVYVAWHGGLPGGKDEGDRSVWMASSADDGRTFGRERAVSDPPTGACGCCGVRALADPSGTVYVLYRSAREIVHRDTFLMTSRDHGASFTSRKLQDWSIAACPMSTFSLAETPAGVLAAWETAGQVQWLRIDQPASQASSPVAAPGSTNNRKHPVVTANDRGETLLVWTEGTGWNRGGSVAWQLFSKNGTPASERGQLPGVPTWSFAAVAVRADRGFLIVY